jgi:hypothetical protein
MDPVVGSIIVAVILLAVIILIIHKLVSDKKKGKFSCGGHCTECHGCGSDPESQAKKSK